MVYVYSCDCGNVAERICKVDERNEPFVCADCGAQMERIPSFRGGLETEHPVWLNDAARDMLQVENEPPVTTRKEHDNYCRERGIVCG